MFKSKTEFVVRYAETDQMGIVHHSNYPIWFEAGRTDFIKKMGMPYSQIEEKGILLPLIELVCRFKSYVRYEEEVVVETSILELTFTRVTFHYEVYKKGQKQLITSGETMHVWTKKNLKPVNIKKYDGEIYKLLIKAYEKN